MADHLRPNFPLWARGEPGFKIEPNFDNRWYWRFLDFNGYAIEVSPAQFASESEALNGCATYWAHHRTRLQALADQRQAQSKRTVAPEWRM